MNVDMFAGQCAISKAFKANGYHTVSLDLVLDDRDDTYQILSC